MLTANVCSPAVRRDGRRDTFFSLSLARRRSMLGRMQLWPFEVRWADEIGRTIAPRGLLGGVLDDVDLGARFADDCRESAWQTALLLRFSLWLAWLAPLWMHFRLRTFG